MKKLKIALFAYLLFDVLIGGYCGGLLPLTPAAAAQAILANTTLSAAVADSSVQRIVLASATGVNAPSSSDFTKATYLFVDREVMDVTAVNSTTITVVRGAASSAAAPHASGALVFVVPQYLSTNFATLPQGSCTRASELVLPRIQFGTGLVSDCNNGVWIQGDALATTRPNGPIIFPPLGNVLYTGVETNGTAAGATTEMYCEEIDMPYSKLITGLALLNGTTATTDNHNVELYDFGGKLLANSAAAGAIASGASAWQKYNFTTPFYAVGPAQYFGCFTANGTTATVRHTITSVNDVFIGNKITGLVFGTIPASITAPSSFTTALGPYLQIY